LLADGPTPFTGGSGGGARDVAFDRLDAGTVTHAPDASPQAVGRSAARAVVQRLRALATLPGTMPARRGGA
jgi:hypothetical protein